MTKRTFVALMVGCLVMLILVVPAVGALVPASESIFDMSRMLPSNARRAVCDCGEELRM